MNEKKPFAHWQEEIAGVAPAPRPPTLREFLDEHERNLRTNVSNDGRGFEKELEITAGGYVNRRIATLRKVSPPTRLVGTGANRKVIFLSNPFLDYVGTWTARHGRALFVEAKSTSRHRLPFMRSGGLTVEQLNTIKTWRIAGAATCLLWQFNGRVVLFLPEDLVEFERLGAASLEFESGRPVTRGEGNVVWNFLPVLEAAIWPQEKSFAREPDP